MFWAIGDIVETRGGIWELTFIGTTTYLLRNDTERLHVLTHDEMNELCTKVNV